MKVKIIQDEPKNLVIEFEDADRGIPELIRNKLVDSKDVEFVSVGKEHPEIGWNRLVVKSSKNARSLVLKAIDELQDEMKELASSIPKK
jgi:DNA-directed RNA polymerase subunit L